MDIYLVKNVEMVTWLLSSAHRMDVTKRKKMSS